MRITTDPKQLRMKCKPVLRDTNMKKLSASINEAVRLMQIQEGVGLAANQVGIDRQFIVAVISENEINKIRVFLNPSIISHSDDTSDDEEGCLSYPNQYGTLSRWNQITLKHMSGGGRIIKETFDGLNARIIQHECDHLQGISCMDKARNIHIKDSVAAS